MSLIVLSYQVPHRKTQDILKRLKEKNCSAKIVGLPFTFVSKHKVLYATFPPAENVSPRQFCHQHGFRYQEFGSLPALENETVLIGGAQLLPKDFVTANTVIHAQGG